MPTIKHATPGAAVTVLDSELDGLANGGVSGVSGSGTGTVYDGATGLNLVGDLELVVTFGAAPTAGTTVEVYMVGAPDGTNYSDGDRNSAELVVVFTLRNNAANRVLRRDVPLPPHSAKFFIRNNSGQSTSGTANALKLFPHNISSA